MHSKSIVATVLAAVLSTGVLASPALVGLPEVRTLADNVATAPHAKISVPPTSNTTDGTCGMRNGNICGGSLCCSHSGTCGDTVGSCGEGCQREYGTCGLGAVVKFAPGAPVDKLAKNFKGKTRPTGPRPTGPRPTGTRPPRPTGTGGLSGPPPSGNPPAGPPPSGDPPNGSPSTSTPPPEPSSS